MEVHFGLRILDRGTDHATVIITPVLTRPGNCGTVTVMLVKLLEQHGSQRRIREVDEARLCGTGLPMGPIALPALGRKELARVEKSIMTLDSNRQNLPARSSTR